jgi:BirA family transcriptional regulator, biotin operon repressor / biotin---[acetyl-CoA-carboxylase] ligase
MAALPEDLALMPLQRALATRVVGETILRYDRVGSTNDIAKQQALAGRPEGLVVLAEEQTAGRGRAGRTWRAPAGSSVLMSLLLRPAWLPAADAFVMTMLAGVALCETVEQVALVRAALKWPNDLLLPLGAGDTPVLRKAAGILCETQITGGRLDWVVIGVGLNVHSAPTGNVDGQDLAQSATSLGAAAGRRIERDALLGALLKRIDTRYQAVRHGQRDELFAAWRARLATLGQPVTVRLPARDANEAQVLEGLAEDVDHAGALRVRDAKGAIHHVTAGDIEG